MFGFVCKRFHEVLFPSLLMSVSFLIFCLRGSCDLKNFDVLIIVYFFS